MQGKTLAQVWALTLGAVLVLVGLVGFLVEPSFAVGDSAERGTLILFDINGWHNVVHLLSGIVGLAMAGTAAKARLFSIGYGAVYVLVTILASPSATAGCCCRSSRSTPPTTCCTSRSP